jgi:predicted nucleic acid-binding protein
VIVVDASVLMEALVGPGASIPRLRSQALTAPHVIDAEVAHTLRRFVMNGTLAETTAAAALRELTELGLDRHAHTPLLPRVWELRHTVTAYGAMYVALAERLDAPLVTCDARLAGAPGVRATVEVLGDAT